MLFKEPEPRLFQTTIKEPLGIPADTAGMSKPEHTSELSGEANGPSRLIHRLVHQAQLRPARAAIAFLAVGIILSGVLVVLVLDDLRQRATLESARSYASIMTVVRQYYTSVVVDRAKKAGMEVSTNYHDSETAIPPPATMTIEVGKRMSDRVPLGSFRYISRYPFKNREGGPANRFEDAALDALVNGRQREFIQFASQPGTDRTTLYYAQPVAMGEGCVACHNAHPDSIKTDWQVGDVRGAQFISLALPPLLPSMDYVLSHERGVIAFSVLLLVGIGLISFLLLVLMQRLRKAVDLAEMRNVQLSKARLIAENSAAAKSRIINNVSHELRTPMNAIVGFSNLMSEEVFGPIGSERYKLYAADIHNSAHQLLDIINNMLSMAEIASDQTELSAEEIDTARELQRLISASAVEAETRNVSLQLDTAAAFPAVMLDRRAFRKMMSSLISNAARHAGPGATAVISAQVDKQLVRFTVSDNGQGVSESELKRILQPFEGGSDPEYSNTPGIGLGLNIVQELSALLDGTLRITSQKGKGFRCEVVLPATCIIKDNPAANDRDAAVPAMAG